MKYETDAVRVLLKMDHKTMVEYLRITGKKLCVPIDSGREKENGPPRKINYPEE